MIPRLIAISGASKGTTFALAAEEISIGRDPANCFSLNDPSVSRRHCLIRANGTIDGFHIIDLESYNGTFVNGVPVAEKPLAHGDQIALGDIRFIFLTHEDHLTSTPSLQDGDLISRSTIRLERERAFYLRPESAVQEISGDLRGIRERNALLKISTSVNSIRETDKLQRRLLELMVEVMPAERGAILLADEEGLDFVSRCGWNRMAGADDSISVSQTISRQVLREVVAILSNDAVHEVGVSPSLLASEVCSLLCVPIVAFDKPLGVMYLDTSSRVAQFDEAHLQLLTAIAGIAAVAFENARGFELLEKENRRLQHEVKLTHQMIGESAAMQEVYKLLARVAPASSTVLLLGESGTGKELAARAIHLNSPRASKPFVAINCATLTESLLESELFGHEKGAFTGAIAQKRGKLEVADGGTVFLDEVGELSPAIQAKLLRALQTREFERVGGTRAIKVDVRMIAATNRDLKAAIKAGQFREDLYYRLNVVSIPLPPLRERREDIPLLAAYFVAEYSRKCKRRVTGISADARRLMRAYDWPGNVRQLENAIERAVVLGATELIAAEDLPETVFDSVSFDDVSKAVETEPALFATDTINRAPAGYHETIRDAKRQLITTTLRQTRGNFTEAAKLLGIHPNNLHRLIRNLNLRVAERNHS
jgi:Nif-specific regulatory protein